MPYNRTYPAGNQKPNTSFRSLAEMKIIDRTQFIVTVRDSPDAVKSVFHVFRPFEKRIISVLTFYSADKNKVRCINIKVADIQKKYMHDILDQLREKSEDIYHVEIA